MSQISIIEYGKLENAKRVDSEYYKPSNLALAAKLKSIRSSTLGSLSLQINRNPMIYGFDYIEKGIPYFRIDDLFNPIIDTDQTVFISQSVHNKFRSTALKRNDILMGVRGNTIGRLGLYTGEDFKANISPNLIYFRLKDSNSAPFVIGILCSEIGQRQITRFLAGTGQPTITSDLIKKIQIPNFSDTLKEKISTIIIDSINKFNSGKQSFKQAEVTFYSSLNLINWKPKYNKTFQRTFGEVQDSFRIDGEYFQPKYDELLKIIRKNANYCKTIGSIKTFNQRGAQPKYFEDGTLRVINSQHILETHLDYDNFERTNESFWDSEKESRVFKNDILIYTTGANIGRANVYLQDEKVLASNHTNILRVREENPIYVGFALNSLVGRMQTEKMKTGSAQAEIYPSAFNRFVIPFIDKKKQDQISELYVQSYELSNQSKQLIAKAKRAVEIAIEQNEKIAMRYLDSNK